MKTSTLLQSFLLTAALLLVGTSVVHAHNGYPITLRGSDFHGCQHTPGWHTGKRHERSYHLDRHWKAHGKHYKRHHGGHDRGDWHADREHWQHGNLDNRNNGGRHG